MGGYPWGSLLIRPMFILLVVGILIGAGAAWVLADRLEKFCAHPDSELQRAVCNEPPPEQS